MAVGLTVGRGPLPIVPSTEDRRRADGGAPEAALAVDDALICGGIAGAIGGDARAVAKKGRVKIGVEGMHLITSLDAGKGAGQSQRVVTVVTASESVTFAKSA